MNSIFFLKKAEHLSEMEAAYFFDLQVLFLVQIFRKIFG